MCAYMHTRTCVGKQNNTKNQPQTNVHSSQMRGGLAEAETLSLREAMLCSGSGFMDVINPMAHNWSFWDRLPLCQKSFRMISSILNY